MDWGYTYYGEVRLGHSFILTNNERPVAYNRKARKFCVTLALLGYRNCKDDLWKFLAACAQQASLSVSSSIAAMKRFWKSEWSENNGKRWTYRKQHGSGEIHERK